MSKKGFVSYIHEDAAVALCVRDILQSAFPGQLEVFVSSHDLRPGNWLDQLRQELRTSSFVFPLLSPRSITRPWVNFESGAAFVAANVTLIPLYHRGIGPAELPKPYSDFEGYNLRSPDAMRSLGRNLALLLKVAASDVDVNLFCQEICRLDNVLPRSFASYEELLEVASFSGALEVAADPEPVYIRKLDLWDRVSLHGRVLADKFAIVLSGSTSETMGFSIHRTPISEGRRFLLVKLDGTKHSVCRDLNKLMRLTIDGSVAPCFIEDQVHHDDRQFCELKDGYLVYELPASSRASRLIQKLDFGFWKSELSNLLMRLYFA